MSRFSLVEQMANKQGIDMKNSSIQELDMLWNKAKKIKNAALAEGDKVALVGFGTFAVKERAARTGLNPQTKAKIEIPASKAPSFKAGKALKDAVNA